MSKKEVIDLIESIRTRPSMYIGDTSHTGIGHLIRDLCRYFLGIKKANSLKFKLSDQLTGKLTSEGMSERFWSLAPVKGDAFENSRDYLKLALPTLNALSQDFEIVYYNDSDSTRHRFRLGELIEGEIDDRFLECLSIEIEFKLNSQILQLPDGFEYDFILTEIRRLAFLFPNSTLELESESASAKFRFESGLEDRLRIEGLRRSGDFSFATNIRHKFSDFLFEASFAFSTEAFGYQHIESFVNYVSTPAHGTHVTGLIRGLGLAMNDIQSNLGDIDIEISEKRISLALIAFIHLQMREPRYLGSSSTRLESREVVEPISSLVKNTIIEMLANDPVRAKQLIRLFDKNDRNSPNDIF